MVIPRPVPGLASAQSNGGILTPSNHAVFVISGARRQLVPQPSAKVPDSEKVLDARPPMLTRVVADRSNSGPFSRSPDGAKPSWPEVDGFGRAPTGVGADERILRHEPDVSANTIVATYAAFGG
jgi:hypothetical protein